MIRPRRTPLAWRNLTHHPVRLLVAVGGIGFAVVLMFMETGFEHALYDSTTRLYRELDGELFLVSRAYNTMVSGEQFSRRRLYQARACPGVRGVYPLYMQAYGCLWKGLGEKGRRIRVLGVDPSDPVLKIPQVALHASELRRAGTALFDLRSKPWFGVPTTLPELVGARAELGGRSIRVVGAFELGTDFVSDGTVIVSDANFVRHCPERAARPDPLEQIDVGVVQLEEGAAVDEVQSRLNDLLPGDVKALTRDEMIAQEIDFWRRGTGVGFIFSLGTWIGFAVGVVVCYQVINGDVTDHLTELATLKAMGYRNLYLVGFVLQEALWLSVLSFLPGLAVSLALYSILAGVTGMLMQLTVGRAAWIFLLTGLMCTVSGGLAVRKLLAADPAELY